MLNADAAYSSNRYFSIFPLFSSVAGNGSSVGAVGGGALSGQLHGLGEDGVGVGWGGRVLGVAGRCLITSTTCLSCRVDVVGNCCRSSPGQNR